MKLSNVSQCPACDGPLTVRRLQCNRCGTAVEGRFTRTPFEKLTSNQQQFVQVFLIARGNIKEVERLLGISYPTVRSRLDDVLAALGHDVQPTRNSEKRTDILHRLEEGKLTVAQAIERLRGETSD